MFNNLAEGEEAMAEINNVVDKPEVAEEASSVKEQVSGKWDWVADALQGLPALIWHLVCAVGASSTIVGWLGQLLPIWIAAPLGTVLGVVAGTFFAFIAAQLVGSGVTTLFELSVSSGICLVLAGILFPVFGQAREKARQTSCASNLKTISGAMLMYAQDYDDLFPPAENWMDSVDAFCPPSPKGKAKDSVYRCPSVPTKRDDVYGYAFNRNTATKSVAKIRNPYTKVLLYDSTTLTRNAADAETSLPVKKRHLKVNNIAFVDGHVKRIKENFDAESSPKVGPAITP
jgi:prepilin-type processing-associated H-X9-DG protein